LTVASGSGTFSEKRCLQWFSRLDVLANQRSAAAAGFSVLAGSARMFGIGTTELLIILGIVVVIFGARRLPELGSGLGQAIKNFKKGVSTKEEIDVTPKKDDATESENPS
jgi:sec-independent protein translocase protein TatA